MRLGKRGRMNQETNRKLAEMFLKKGITHCENCGSTWALTWAHRMKRRYYSTVDELTDFDQVALLCVRCHNAIEFSREKTEELFGRLRG